MRTYSRFLGHKFSLYPLLSYLLAKFIRVKSVTFLAFIAAIWVGFGARFFALAAFWLVRASPIRTCTFFCWYALKGCHVTNRFFFAAVRIVETCHTKPFSVGIKLFFIGNVALMVLIRVSALFAFGFVLQHPLRPRYLFSTWYSVRIIAVMVAT